MSAHWTELCMAWSRLVFKDRVELLTPKVRAMRLLEEALELAQAEDVFFSEVLTIARQVYERPVGDPYRELGGVLITLSAYAATKEKSSPDIRWMLESVFMAEFTRIMDPEIMDRVRSRNLSGDKIGFHPEEKQ